MPIKGLTNQKPELVHLGELRKGAPKTDPRRPGKDLTYFRFTSDIPEVATAFHDAYDGEPRLINLFLPHPQTDDNWEAWQEEYVAGGLVHRCDGETMVRWQQEDGTYSNTPKPCPYESGEKPRTQKRPGCKVVGRLQVLIPELKRLGVVTVLTGSYHDIANLDKQLRALEDLNRGSLTGIPLQLRRRPHKISTPSGDGKRARREKWLLSIEAAPQYVELQLANMERAGLPAPDDAPDEEDVVDVDPTTGEILNPEPDEENDLFPPDDTTTTTASGVVVYEGQEPEPEPKPAQQEPLFPEEIPASQTLHERHLQLLDGLQTSTKNFYEGDLISVFNAIRSELGDDWEWPHPDDSDKWNRAYMAARNYAWRQINAANKAAAQQEEQESD